MFACRPVRAVQYCTVLYCTEYCGTDGLLARRRSSHRAVSRICSTALQTKQCCTVLGNSAMTLAAARCPDLGGVPCSFYSTALFRQADGSVGPLACCCPASLIPAAQRRELNQPLGRCVVGRGSETRVVTASVFTVHYIVFRLSHVSCARAFDVKGAMGLAPPRNTDYTAALWTQFSVSFSSA